ncbi:hypothetical protein I2I05_11730 [Hymenobacter sp. BT683]|uniref:STAS domain-containing protein n=1 Tax=Hymenobacter jeongseonensis TaxID=2791027 RepID=A0ABS0II76_9BACT|nr:hypothetical protein [Hymenobacter jeongseonensis]MBF9238065.1 hypothetical protein [Hymenobacter jeongseonensis]
MLAVYPVPLPGRYVLIVASARQVADPHALARALHRAWRRGPPRVWLDCSLVAAADAGATARVLRACHGAFAKRGMALLVAHAGADLRRALVLGGASPGPVLVESLVAPLP